MEYDYDSSFWLHYNRIKESDLDEQLIQDLEQQASLTEQFSSKTKGSVYSVVSQLSPKEVKEDLEMLKKYLEAYHTGLFDYREKAD